MSGYEEIAVGAWGPGLYSDDFALDLKATISTACRLPFSGQELLALLEELYPCASAPEDEDHTTFWLVAADQLHRRGISSEATARAIAIVDEQSNLTMLRDLGMSDADLRKRNSMLNQFRDRLAGPLPDKMRRTLRSPQAFLVEPGDVFTFPVDSRGNVCNPYFTRPEDARFVAAGWGSCLVLAAGHALGYLAWYQIAPDLLPGRQRPTLEHALTRIDPSVNRVGTLSRARMRRMGLERIGAVNPPRVDDPLQELIVSAVGSDICVSNILSRWLPSGTIA
jgi:hypothetical protein